MFFVDDMDSVWCFGFGGEGDIHERDKKINILYMC